MIGYGKFLSLFNVSTGVVTSPNCPFSNLIRCVAEC